jgi:N-acetylneuraminate synthase
MLEMHQAFPEKVFVLSDHTNNNACLGAVALGASILERHFTDHMRMNGCDIICSMDELSLHRIVGSAEMAQMRGTKKPAEEEQLPLILLLQRFVVLPILKGEKYQREYLGENGEPVKFWQNILTF